MNSFDVVIIGSGPEDMYQLLCTTGFKTAIIENIPHWEVLV
jgi:ribulose 1,5-bisphosphate synthetase/thiazole synthase